MKTRNGFLLKQNRRNNMISYGDERELDPEDIFEETTWKDPHCPNMEPCDEGRQQDVDNEYDRKRAEKIIADSIADAMRDIFGTNQAE